MARVHGQMEHVKYAWQKKVFRNRISSNLHQEIRYLFGSTITLCYFLHFATEYAGTFTWSGSNQLCSDIGKEALSDEAECKKAAASLDLDYSKGGMNSNSFPTGCFQMSRVFWNKNAYGKSQAQSKAICKDFGGFITSMESVPN